MTERIAVLDDYQHAALKSADWSRLDGQAVVESFSDHFEGEALVDRLRNYGIIVAMRERTRFDEALLQRLPNLRLLITTAMVNAAIDVAAANRLGIVVSGTRGVAGPAAEHTWALLLALARRIPEEVTNFRAAGSAWQITVGSGLAGKTLGVAGIGKLGTLVAGYGRAFGMNVLGWSKNNTPERSRDIGVGFAASLDELLAQSDVVSLHLTLTTETKGIIGRRELSLMRPGAVLVNTSRGSLVNEGALIHALREGSIGGAALDVFETEPLPADHPFRTLPNVVATPHLGYVTEETYRIYYGDAVESISAWLAGSPIRVLKPS
jgi:phosphoglycerate dehydrogenase-like enzyme